MSVLDLARPEIRELAPYASARSIAGISPVTLNANESPWAAPGDSTGKLNRYPDPQPVALVGAIAEHFAVETSQVLVTRGSDEAIDLLIRAFCAAGRHAVIQCPPTFGMYAISARIQDARVCNVPLLADEGFGLDLPGLELAAEDPAVRLVFLCRPNNPTGSMYGAEGIRNLCRQLAEQALVIVDEAYMDFASEPSMARDLEGLPNLAVLRTFSKAHALAGARCGCLLADADVISLLKRILAPYPLPTATIDAALKALEPDNLAATQRQTRMLNEGRAVLARVLEELPYVRQQWPSEANFILLRVDDGPALCDWLAGQGVLVRNFHSNPVLKNCLRISIGSPPENARLTQLLKAYTP
ncbi:MAG: histidinol-phosphate transaminase [Pseudomonadota bacterium]